MSLSKGQKTGLGIAGAGAVAIGFLYLNPSENSSTGGFNGFTETKKAIGDILTTTITTTKKSDIPANTPISESSISKKASASYSGATRINSFGDTVYSDNFVGALPKGAIHETTSTKKEMSADNKKFGGYNEFFQPVSKIPSSYNPFKK